MAFMESSVQLIYPRVQHPICISMAVAMQSHMQVHPCSAVFRTLPNRPTFPDLYLAFQIER